LETAHTSWGGKAPCSGGARGTREAAKQTLPGAQGASRRGHGHGHGERTTPPCWLSGTQFPTGGLAPRTGRSLGSGPAGGTSGQLSGTGKFMSLHSGKLSQGDNEASHRYFQPCPGPAPVEHLLCARHAVYSWNASAAPFYREGSRGCESHVTSPRSARGSPLNPVWPTFKKAEGWGVAPW
jgi:hypothetical protein